MSRNMKDIRIFYLEMFLFLAVKFNIYEYRRVFEMSPCEPSAQMS